MNSNSASYWLLKFFSEARSKLPASPECRYRRHPGVMAQLLSNLPQPTPPLTFSILLVITIFCYILCNSSIHSSLTRSDLIPPYCLFTVSILFQLKLRTYDCVSYSNTKLSSFQKVYAQILSECREKKFFIFHKSYLEVCTSNICIGKEDTGGNL